MDLWETINFATTIVFSSCAFFIFIHMLNKLLQSRHKSKDLLPFLGLANIFLFISISFLFAAWFDYYRWESSVLNVGLYKFHLIFLIIGLASLVFLTEYTYQKTKYIITLYTISVLIAVIIFNSYEYLTLLQTIFGVSTFLLIPVVWFFTFFKPTSGYLRNRVIFALIGSFLVLLGIFGRNNSLGQMVGIYLYSLGTLISTIGLSFIGYGFSAFSTFSDIRWKEKLRELFVISNTGVCLYAYSFEKNLTLEDSDLIAGGLSGIQILLSEIMKTREALQLIDYQNIKIMLRQAETTVYVLIIKKESSFLQYKLNLFSREFQTFFKDILQHWLGQIDVFAPTRTLIQRVFELDTPS